MIQISTVYAFFNYKINYKKDTHNYKCNGRKCMSDNDLTNTTTVRCELTDFSA